MDEFGFGRVLGVGGAYAALFAAAQAVFVLIGGRDLFGFGGAYVFAATGAAQAG